MTRLVLLLVFLSPGILLGQSAELSRAAASITEADFYNKVEIIAHDSMMGRDTPSPGLDMTAHWVADEFRRLGLEPGGDAGSYIQGYLIESVGLDEGGSVFNVTGGTELSFGPDAAPLFGAPSGVEIRAGVTLLAGSALPRHFEEDHIRGRHLVVIPPAGMEEAGMRGLYGIIRSAMAAGPASIILVSGASDSDWERQAANRRPSTRTPWSESEGGGFPTMISLRAGSLARALAPLGLEVPAPPADMDEPGVMLVLENVEFTVQAQPKVLSEFHAPNTVGILRGSDPELRDEYVVFSGHMDHVGTGTPNAQGDSIFNGADDDASGTVALVEMAEAFVMLDPAPKRSIIFVAVSGEEKGLWGSAYFASYPPVPAEDMVANVNADMIARNWPDSIVVIGKEHSDLGKTLEYVAQMHPELNMVPMDDIWPEENFYGRSDHYNFAVKGIPILFFFNGPHEDYHQVTDEIQKIDAEKAARITQLMFYLGVEIANNPERPQWNPESYAEIVGGGGR
jgi:hypothetical protein